MCRIQSILCLVGLPAVVALSGLASRGTAAGAHAASPVVVSRRNLLLHSTYACTAAAALGAPRPAHAANAPPKIDLNEQLVLILRVREASGQESRLIKTGKYKTVQRLNIKRAVKFMIENYDLNSRFVKASSFAPTSQISSAGQYGQAAVESLIQILEYFPDKLVANDLSRDQEQFVVAALDNVNNNIDRFFELMPPSAVAVAKAQLEEENRLNELEYKEVNDDPLINVPIK